MDEKDEVLIKASVVIGAALISGVLSYCACRKSRGRNLEFNVGGNLNIFFENFPHLPTYEDVTAD